MNKGQLQQVMFYLDAEFPGIMNRMTDDEKAARAKHWAAEVGTLDYDMVMQAIRTLAEKGYPPSTAQIRAEIRKFLPAERENVEPYCRVFRDPSGQMCYDLRFRNGGGGSGLVGKLMQPWELIKWRYLATKKPEHQAAWESIIMAKESGGDWESLVERILMTMEAAA